MSLKLVPAQAVIINVVQVYILSFHSESSFTDISYIGQNSYKIVLWFVILAVIADFNVIIEVYSISTFLSIEQIRKSIWTVFSAAVVSDFAIIFSMCYYLHKSRSVTNFSSTSKKLLILMHLIVISNLATRLNSWKGHKSECGNSHLLGIAPKVCSGDTGEQSVNILLIETQIPDQVKDGRNCEA
ncbi:hypothetical protein IW262DRAFT_1301977 [Armillaria fumosa]|nr:hypothetical protein IW262DRAFT_1301977 [Armillaria fumosa]